ncbi:GDP-mannose 4,6-dehydratase [Gammaproteobacteria bacterium]|nr:GDP-mannose 4,6-dehydratase [Gammaproteobacteria bacterium]MDC0511105.1 GDP-mannose 4,6-dehydratase [bacterium]
MVSTQTWLMNECREGSKKALIIGFTGQDGVYLTKFLARKNYKIYGTSRDLEKSMSNTLESYDIKDNITKLELDPLSYDSIYKIIEQIKPDEIYNLSAQSSVGKSFKIPIQTINSISLVTLNILEACRVLDNDSRIYNAGSSEVFGDTRNRPADEDTQFNPVSPYALAKSFATKQVSMYRDLYNVYACTGILFNHESPLRANQYVTKKIISSACRIANGSNENLKLGNINIYRDWGYAPDYVDAMWRMLQLEKPQDFVIGTGQSTSLKEFTAEAFRFFDLDWEEHTDIDPGLLRSSDIEVSSCNPAKAKSLLGWVAKTNLQELIRKMIEYEMENYEE